MKRVAYLPADERRELFAGTAAVRRIGPIVIEKDFWVCYTLKELFSSEFLKDKIMFKGGTSLSKVFHLIERFSEDIDLILDWKEILEDDPYGERSKNKQDRYNRNMDVESRRYIAEKILPEVQRILGGICTVEIHDDDPDNILIHYPGSFKSAYVSNTIKLEIGAKASWVPSSSFVISPYSAQEFPEVFENPTCTVNAVHAERTFWEKATILHQEAHRPENKPQPGGYSRHYYDMIKLYNSPVYGNAMKDFYLLEKVVAFKNKFYPRAWAHYDSAKPPTFRLIPDSHVKKALEKDYLAMREMIFGEVPKFKEILHGLASMEDEINNRGISL